MACILPLAPGEGLMFRMNWMPEVTIAAAWLIFLATYAVVALGKLPVYRIDRAGAALLGGSLMIATGALSLDEAPCFCSSRSCRTYRIASGPGFASQWRRRGR